MTTPQQSHVGGQAPALFMVFDVESIGLHGEGFAVAYAVVNRDGAMLDEGFVACPPENASGTDEDRAWVADNVPSLSAGYWSPREMRNAFWEYWVHWKASGAVLVADCAWPVEARFLAACVDDDPSNRKWEGPYPLHDLASVLLALGRDPLATNERLPNELPAHHPLMDARQSARLLIEALSARHAQAAAPGVQGWQPPAGYVLVPDADNMSDAMVQAMVKTREGSAVYKVLSEGGLRALEADARAEFGAALSAASPSLPSQEAP